MSAHNKEQHHHGRKESIMARPIESYLPSKYTPEDVKELYAQGNCSIQQCRSIVEAKYRLRIKDGLQEALGDYLCSPAEHGESFLAQIMSEMLEIL